jgi:RNA polymerase sigma factor (sigma-70 family)
MAALGESSMQEEQRVASGVATEASQAAGVLAERILAGDRAAEDELVSTYRRGVFVIAVARTRDREAALDLTQEILIAVLKALRGDRLRDSEKLAAFIQGTARNLINNYLRTKVRHAEVELNVELNDEACGPDPVEELESLERRRLVQRELESFSAIDRKILLLSLVDGHSLAEVAQKLNLSHDAVRARKSRAVRKITGKFAGLSQS